MTNFHIFFFNETMHRQFLGHNRELTVSDLPVWSNFKVQDVLSVSNIKALPVTSLQLERKEDAEKALTLLGSQEVADRIILGRTGNVLVIDWLDLTSRLPSPHGITKIQVGKVPTEFYFLKKKDLIGILKNLLKRRRLEEHSILNHLFNTVLFFNFERIAECAGYSFLLRNSYEYYLENLRINERLLDSGFIPLYEALKITAASATVVGKHAVILNSLLGNGVKVNGCVESSVVFNGVSVGRNSKIRNSVILPFNEIAEEVVIENSLVLGGSNRVIARGSVIGGQSSAENNHFPDIIKKGLTILGEDINVPSGSQIGSGCLIQGVLERSPVPLIVTDGSDLTLRRDRSPA